MEAGLAPCDRAGRHIGPLCTYSSVVERWTLNPCVVGSNPTRCTTQVNLSGGVGLTNIPIVSYRVDTGLTQGGMPKGELAFLKSLGQAYEIPQLAPVEMLGMTSDF